MPSLRRCATLTIALILSASFAVAHDFWLVPDAFRVAVAGEVVVRGQTSSAFPTTLSAVTPDRVTEARIVGASASDDERITALSTHDNSLVLRHRPRTPGQKIVAVAVGWRLVNETAASFRKYLVAEGAEDALKHYDRAGQLPTGDIVRRYAKYGKTALEVGDGPRAFDRVIGHPLEFIPLSDPGAARASSELRVRLVFQGQPLARVRVHAGVAPTAGRATPPERLLVTSDDGVVAVPVGVAGLWNIRTIHVVPTPPGADANWDVHWATFVYAVR